MRPALVLLRRRIHIHHRSCFSPTSHRSFNRLSLPLAPVIKQDEVSLLKHYKDQPTEWHKIFQHIQHTQLNNQKVVTVLANTTPPSHAKEVVAYIQSLILNGHV